jgi:bifunctional non-homologous end joining protein LigD
MNEIVESIDLYFKEGTSDKEYHLQLVHLAATYAVDFQYGRRGSTLKTGRKIELHLLEQAKEVYDAVKSEKLGKGYHEGEGGTSYVPAGNSAPVPVNEPRKEIISVGVGRKVAWEAPKPEPMIPQLLNPIEETEVEKYLNDPAWGMQEKKDGKHQMIRVVDGVMTVYNKKGKEIGYPSEWAESVTVQNVILDGEAIGEVFHAFDLLEVNGKDFRTKSYSDRYAQLSFLLKAGKLGERVVVVPLWTTSEKRISYEQLKKNKKEGVVFKRLSATYKPGRPSDGGDMLKSKFYATLTARVAKGREGKHSVGLELLDGKVWVNVGNVTVAQNKELPSVGSHVEIRYLYGYKGGSLYQPTYLNPRDDTDDSDCRIAQVKYKSEE